MAHFTARPRPQAEPEIFQSIARVYARDPDFAVMCAALTAQPKFGYGPVRAQTDACGKALGFTYGTQPLEFED